MAKPGNPRPVAVRARQSLLTLVNAFVRSPRRLDQGRDIGLEREARWIVGTRLAWRIGACAMMKHSSLVTLVAFVCASLSACAALTLYSVAAIYGGAAAVGVAGGGLLIASAATMPEWMQQERCAQFAAKGITVADSEETAVPTDEGEVQMFEPALWRSAFEGEGYPRLQPKRTPTEGMLAVTERSVLLVPPSGAPGVRIPYEMVLNIEIQQSPATSLIVRSCHGRFDIVTVWQRQPRILDAAATAAAAAAIKARLAGFHPGADKEADAVHR
jgi:hypothetical protein